MTQKTIVLNELKLGNIVCSPSMWHTYGITRLSDVIFRLRKDGHPIKNRPSEIWIGFDEYYLDKEEQAAQLEQEVFNEIEDRYYSEIGPALTGTFLRGQAYKLERGGL